MNRVCVANNQLNFELFREVTKAAPGNAFMSSFSILSALAMAHLGAKGETASQMEKTLHLNESDDFDAEFKALMSDLNNPENQYTLKMANKAFGEKSFTFLQPFLDSANEYYGAPLETVDFQNSAENTRQYINKWVKAQTEGKIIDLLKEGSVGSDTKLVLTNAIYFRADWQSKFQEQNTLEHEFRLGKTLITSVQMMSQEGDFKVGYVDELKLQILELPYDGEELSMVILKPADIEDDADGLQQIESLISASTLEKWIQEANMQSKYTEVKLPRFSIENSFDLGDALKKLGMVDAFSGARANFTGMSEQSNLYISQVAHAAFVRVNETGTEAAAATGVVMMPTSLRQLEAKFIADQPFLFHIKDNKSGCILFSGKLYRP